MGAGIGTHLLLSTPGPGYGGSSTTSLTLSVGSKTFTTQAGMAYVVGLRVRLVKDTTHIMEGTITAYSGTSMTVDVDLIVIGTGTFTAWNIGLAGVKGVDGAGVQTPWITDVNAAGFSLSGLGKFITPQNGLTLATGLNSNIANSQTFLRVGAITGGGNINIGGFTGGSDGRHLILFNPFSVTMTIVYDDASSTPANRIFTMTLANVVLPASRSSAVRFIYDAVVSRWILVSTGY